MPGRRRERIARIIREEASRVVLYELADPRIGFVTVTKVEVSPDLSHARVYVSVYGDESEREQTMEVLHGAARVVQRAYGPRLKTRIIPRVEFEFDPSVEGAIHMSQLINEARASDPDGGAGESAAGSGHGGAGSAERENGAEADERSGADDGVGGGGE
jgi:ribosome-binding factor A